MGHTGKSPFIFFLIFFNGLSFRSNLVFHKVVFPWMVVLDVVLKHVYWLDTYFDVLERVNYEGGNRVTYSEMENVSCLFHRGRTQKMKGGKVAFF